ncbi:MAG: type II secretion system F family protein [Fibrobacter sp.]|jgi:type IV pilus assembly protein PilC|nr:type II secretion system F family protein [Fibrobacter sp.]
MPVFLYKAQNVQGNVFEGQIEAKNKEEAESLLKRKRLIVQSVKKKPTEINLKIGTGIGSADISRFTRMFSSMTSAGLPMLQCLNILEEQMENPALKEVVHKVAQSINGGASLADSLAQHPKVFDKLYCNMVAAGEAGGILEGILLRLADYQEANERTKRKVKKAMMYPVIVFLVAIGAVVALLTFVVPTFANMFTDMGAELPGPTQLVMDMSNMIKDYALLWIVLIVASIVVIRTILKVPAFRLKFDTILLKLPKLGDLLTKTAVARFGRTLGTLLNAGVSIIDALQVTAKTAGNTAVEKAIMRISQSIAGGKPIVEPMKEAGIFPPMVVQMTGVGEKTGDLGGMLLKVADFYDEEVDAAVDSVTSMLEPIIIVFMGGAVGFIMVAMYMPMFSMGDLV